MTPRPLSDLPPPPTPGRARAHTAGGGAAPAPWIGLGLAHLTGTALGVLLLTTAAVRAQPTLDPATEQARCAALATQPVPGTLAGVRPAQITLAEWQPALGRTPAFCKVQGQVPPSRVDPASGLPLGQPVADPIRFQVNLPSHWPQRRAVHVGGGGFNGSLKTGEDQIAHAPSGSLSPLQRGQVTFGSDSGHQGANWDGRFAQSDESLENFTGLAIKKVRDVAQGLMLRHYGHGPLRTVFAGGSTGGREALAAVQRWPADYDGALAHYPALEYVGLLLQANRIAQALYAPGGWPGSAKMDHLNQRVLAACDALDGLADGLVNNLGACRFDPAILRCPGNIDWGPGCFTDAQLRTVRAIADGQALAFPLAQGQRSTVGFEVLAGANFAGPVDLGVLPELLNPSQVGFNGYLAKMQSEYLKHFITRQRAFDPLQFDPVTGGPWQARLQQVSALHDANNPNLDAFFAKGGKVLMLHGTSDTIVSPRSSVRYLHALQQRYGEAALRAHLRLYLVAGFGHGEGRYQATWPGFDTLERWLDSAANDPGEPVVANALLLGGQQRKLCEYPAYPHYRGSGSVHAAASFVCRRP